ncbi:glycosyl hydrolase family 28-related protein [Methylobacterium nodulans]|uniref:Pectate lyase superfamily protein domain-containing protein n=1 Tax=Methylobacterium nodulans (strain LMG 21967 / CNCM I-2342 / ORS 2060) TaxID=460265 RepID=B8IAQ8_METNO|nr:glycosyl hydrolase family 28-related protein [Methylobacterium nodulans]ACL61103.1 hypothetical protein Mnod_6299 [Methylobacterium nodulans ORS 2060]
MLKPTLVTAALLIVPAFGAADELLGTAKVDSSQNIKMGHVTICKTRTGSSACRLFGIRAADVTNAADYGAKLDGATDDTGALRAARADTPAQRTIIVPNGTYNATYTPPAPQFDGAGNLIASSGPRLWQLHGAATATGAPIIGLGTDVVESFVQGAKYFGRSTSYPNPAPVLRVDATLNHAGGALGSTSNALQTNMTIPANSADLSNFGWANSTTLTSSAWGSGQHVAIASFAKRPSTALSDSRGPRAPIWSLYTEARDETGQPSNLSGPLIGYEHDMFANGGDPDSWRVVHHYVLGRANGRGAKARFGRAVTIDWGDVQYGYPVADRSHVGVAYNTQIGWDTAAFNASEGYAIDGAPAFLMADTMSIGFTADAKSQLKHASNALRYYYNGAEIFNVPDKGGMSVAGSLTLTGLFKAAAYTVSGLPACNATTRDMLAVVSDATSPTYRGALTGGGAVRTPVFCDGVSWSAH